MTDKKRPAVMEKWHEMVASKDMSALEALLAEDAVFHSPVVHTPQKGRELVALYLRSADKVFFGNNFRYEREIIDGHNAVLEFSCKMDGISVNGIDMISWNDEDQIIDFKVMVRPIKAINIVWQRMADMLAESKAG